MTPAPGAGGAGGSAWRRRATTALALIAIAILAMAAHDVPIEHLGVPYPTLVTPPAWLPAAGDIGRIAALVVFCLVAAPFLAGRSLWKACLIVGALECFLSERLRVTVIEFFIAEAWRGAQWIYMLTGLIPWLAVGLAQGAAAVVIARRLARSRAGLALVAIVFAGIATRIAVAPVAEHLATLLDSASGVAEPQTLHSPPYDGALPFIIYLSFIEPTLATFLMARMAWPGLPGGSGAKIGLFTLIILGCTGRYTLLFLNTFWVRQPPLLALAGTGQFVAETVVMAVLVGALTARQAARGPPAPPVRRASQGAYGRRATAMVKRGE